MISYVKKWIAAGVPIDGIGAQAHCQLNEAKNVPASLQALCAVASECAITELDIASASASDYVTVVKACVDIANCVGVTVWGVRDPDSWRAGSSPLLFNSGYSTKPAYAALVSTLGAMTATHVVASTKAATTAVATTSAGPVIPSSAPVTHTSAMVPSSSMMASSSMAVASSMMPVASSAIPAPSSSVALTLSA